MASSRPTPTELDQLSPEAMRLRELTRSWTPPRDLSGVPVLPCALCGGDVGMRHRYTAGEGWMRHGRCKAETRTIVTAVSRTDLPARAVRMLELAGVVPAPWFARPGNRPDVPTGAPPWAFITRAERRTLLKAITNDLPEMIAAERSVGRPAAPWARGCAWCGIGTSSRWFDVGHQTRDGVAAALCATCHRIWDRRCSVSAEPSVWRDQWAAMVETITGVPTSTEEGVTIAPPAWAKGHRGVDDPEPTQWGHLPAAELDRLRDQMWQHHPRHAPPHVAARVRAAEAAEAAQRGTGLTWRWDS